MRTKEINIIEPMASNTKMGSYKFSKHGLFVLTVAHNGGRMVAYRIKKK